MFIRAQVAQFQLEILWLVCHTVFLFNTMAHYNVDMINSSTKDSTVIWSQLQKAQ